MIWCWGIGIGGVYYSDSQDSKPIIQTRMQAQPKMSPNISEILKYTDWAKLYGLYAKMLMTTIAIWIYQRYETLQMVFTFLSNLPCTLAAKANQSNNTPLTKTTTIVSTLLLSISSSQGVWPLAFFQYVQSCVHIAVLITHPNRYCISSLHQQCKLKE